VEEVRTADNTANEGIAKIVYILYLLGIAFGITALVGVVMVYVNREDAPDWQQSHYRFQIRTFWIGVLYLFVGILLSPILIGYLLLLFWVIWLIVRCVKGLKYLERKEAYPQPAGWLF